MIPPIAHVHVRVSHRQVDEAKLAALTSELEDARTAIAAAEDRLRAAEEASLSAADANERSAAETRAEADRLRQELDDATALAAKVAARHADKVRGIMHSQPFLLIFHHHRAYANVVAALMRHVSLQCVCTSSCYVHQVASLEASRDTLKQQMEQLQAKMAEARAEANTTTRELNTKLREKTEELTAAQAMLESAKRAAAETEAALQRAQSDLTAARAEVSQLASSIFMLFVISNYDKSALSKCCHTSHTCGQRCHIKLLYDVHHH